MELDLHTHTTYSDGDLDILGNVDRAISLGLDGIAITDHDNVESWEVIDQNLYPILVIKGVELSTYYKGSSVHVLGYYLNDDGDYQELSEKLEIRHRERLDRIDRMIDLLEPLGIEISRDDILSKKQGVISTSHLANAILSKYPELNLSFDDIYKYYIGKGAPAYVPGNKTNTEDAIELLKRNHCLVVLAHPLLIKRVDYHELLDLGIEGIEGIYPYPFETNDNVVNVGDENNLLVTGGSDYHGPITRNTMGKAYLEGDRAKTFLKRINL